MASSHGRSESSKPIVEDDLRLEIEAVARRAKDASSLAVMVLVVLTGMRQLGLLVLRREIERRDAAFRDSSVVVRCAEPNCGASMELRRKLKPIGRYTFLGKLRYWRCRYQCPVCHAWTFPVDRGLGLLSSLHGHSEEFASSLVLLCTLMPYGKGCALLERLTGVAVSTRLACALTMEVGTRLFRDEMQRAEQAWEQRLENPEKFEPLPAELRTMPRRKRVYFMMDNSKLGIQEGQRGRGAPQVRALRKLVQEARRKKAQAAKRQKLGPVTSTTTPSEAECAASDLPDETWRDVRALLIFDEEDLASCSKKRRQILRRRVIAHVGSLEEWRKLVHLALHEEGVYTAEEVVVIADGGSGIWELVEELLPATPNRRVTEILDWYHAASHLWAVGRALRGSKTAADRKACARWVNPLLDYLAEGKLANVLQRLRKIQNASEAATEVIRKCIEYIDNHRERMHYAQYRKRGMLIGSGAMESVHAWVIQPRCRLPGMRWSLAGANAILRLRCSWASDRWDEDFAHAARCSLPPPPLTHRNLKAAA
jgi:hypothetical protein